MGNYGALDREPQKPPSRVKSAVRETSRLDNFHNVPYLLLDWVVSLASCAVSVVVDHPFIYLLAVVVIGSRMRALGNLLHEASHRKLFRSRSLNDNLGTLLCAWPLAISYRRYVDDHRLHHVYLWDPDKDPDLGLYRLTRTETGSADQCARWRFWLVHVALAVIPVMPWRRLCVDLASNRPRLVKFCVLVLLLSVMEIWTDLFILHIVFSYWLIPFITSYQTIVYWAEIAEHGGMRSLGKMWGSRNWRGNIISRWLIGPHSDDSYHLLHHWFPSVPHYRLAQLDSVCSTEWQRYAEHPQCGGFFLSGGLRRSVIDDIWIGSAPAIRSDEIGQASLNFLGAEPSYPADATTGSKLVTPLSWLPQSIRCRVRVRL
ncbi:fatty acid desaturase family protein [Nocardia sp. NPDC049220]|uniref:fatty acid desaturase family protein n=1 Tax=Nocardia sp. NPDC049220 TaxID=3155273 RepID=UPI003411985D